MVPFSQDAGGGGGGQSESICIVRVDLHNFKGAIIIRSLILNGQRSLFYNQNQTIALP